MNKYTFVNSEFFYLLVIPIVILTWYLLKHRFLSANILFSDTDAISKDITLKQRLRHLPFLLKTIAAALLISMRKAYSPEIPILMFDDIIDKLDPKPREDFLKFLDEYAKSEDVAIIVSQLDSSINDATVKIR